MTSAEVAKTFTDLLKAGDHNAAAAKFNSPDIVSLEAMDGPMARVEGTAAVEAKGKWWEDNHEVSNSVTIGPYVNGNQFAVHFSMDVLTKATGETMHMQEVGLYTVKDGKIVEEKFMY
ncbi:MAG: SnoaL-like domain-containing protein [Bosea sp. (in: a-proteobacteria)]